MKSEELRQRRLPLDTVCVCDANKALRATDPAVNEFRVVDSAIRSIRPGLTLIGRAHTIPCHNDFLTVIKGLPDAESGEVLVIDTQSSDRAVSGGLFPTERCRNHKLRNVLGHLPKEQHDQARSTLKAAWKLDAKEGTTKIEQYAS
jgi:regulator of RNase E activity RraA